MNLKKSLLQNWFLIGILLSAAFLRLFRIADYMTFLGDEGRDVLVVYNILHGHVTLLGPTSSVGGFFLGPIYYYFMAPFLLLFNYDPVGPAVMVALFGVLTVWLVYKIGSEFFGKRAGLIAALLYAISPLVVIYSHSSWNPNLMPIFCLLTLYALYKAFQRNSFTFFLASGIFFGIVMQLHYVGTFLLPIVGVYILASSWIVREGKNIGNFLLGTFTRSAFWLLGVVIGWSPFLLFEARHSFPNIQSIFKFVFHSEEVSGKGNFASIIGNEFARVFERLVTAFPPLEHRGEFPQTLLFAWHWLAILLGIVSIGLFVYQLYRKRKEGKRLLAWSLLLIWFFFGIVLWGFYKKNIYDYYFEFMFPVPFLLVANFLSYISFQKSGKVIAGIILSLLVFINLYSTDLKRLPNRQLDQVRTISRFVLEKAGGAPFNFAVISNGGNSDHAYRYFFKIWGNDPLVIEYPGADPERKSIKDQLLVVCESVPCHPLGYFTWEIAGFGQAEIVDHWTVSVVEIYKLKHYKSPTSVCFPGSKC